MSKKLKVGIAGYGIVGERRHQFIDSHPEMEVVAICDRRFTGDYKPVKEVKAYDNYKALLNESLDVLFVCLPNDIAPEVSIAGLQAGLHVFCEKPPGRTVADIQKVREIESQVKDRKLKYGFNHRYHDSVREALKIASSGELGELINMRGVYGKSAFSTWPRNAAGEWRTSREIAGGGILLDQGIHMVDLMRSFAGDFNEVKSFVTNSYWDLEVEDNAYALLKNEQGKVAILHSTATQWRHQFRLEIFFTKGALILSGILSGSKSYGQEMLTVVYREDESNGNPREQTTTYIRDNSWRDEIFEFANCILNDKPVLIGSSYDALKSMELVYKIYSADEDWQKKFNLPKY